MIEILLKVNNKFPNHAPLITRLTIVIGSDSITLPVEKNE
jgi:hypothetical protein